MSTRVSFRYKKDFRSEELASCVKAIRLQEEGFSVAVFQPETQEVYVIEEHLFEEVYPSNGKMHILSQVEGQWKTETGIRFICFNPVNTQIPEKLYDEQNRKLYLQLLTEQAYDYVAAEEAVEEFGLYTLSGWNKQLYHELQAQYPVCEMHSGMYTLLRMLARQEGEKKAIAFIEGNRLHLATCCGKELLGTNHFCFDNGNDFLYYLVGFLRNTQKDLKDVKLYMGGQVETESLLFTSTRKYVPDLELINSGFNGMQQDQHRFCDLLYGGK